jgi:DNA-binding MarR family transcriptional regulator
MLSFGQEYSWRPRFAGYKHVDIPSLYQHVDVSTTPEELSRLVREVHHACRRGIDERLGCHGISVVQWRALQAISDNPGLPLRRLARLTGHSDQAFGTLVSRLLARGYVARRRGDGRATTHEVTALGRVMLSGSNEIAHGVLTLLFLHLSEDDRQSLQVLLNRVLQAQWRLQLKPLPESTW